MADNCSIIRRAKKQKNERKCKGGGSNYHPEMLTSSHDINSRSNSPVLVSNGSTALVPGAHPPCALSEQEALNFNLCSDSSKGPASNNPKLKAALEKLQSQTDCPIIQNKWHRKFGPPNSWTGPQPPKGSEVFVGKIPRDLFEDELIPVLQKAGNLFEVRLMMDPSGLNRGFAYVKYFTKSEANAAVTILNNYEIRSRQFIGVMKSVDNNRLFIGGIPKNRKQEELLEEMRRLTDDVLDVILYADINDKNKNRGFAFVEYRSHTAAYSARQKLLKNPPLLWGTNIVKVDWAEPEREVDEQTMKKVRILYVRNLALSTTDQQLRELFSKFGGVIERVKKIKDYAFVHFATREQAEEAKTKLQGYYLDNCEIDISWSKPVTNREEYQQRKAASKALSSGPNLVTPIAQAAFGLNGEPILINQRVRTAAGAQGYNASRPYPIRPKQTEESFSSVQNQFVYPSFLQDLTVRGPVEPFGLGTPLPQPVYATERVGQVEDFLAASQEVPYQIAQPQLLQRFQPLIAPSPYNVVATSPISSCWGAQSYIQPGSAAPAFIPATPYVVPTASFTPIPAGGYTSGAQQFFGGQMMTQIPSVTGSNMSIDRT